MNVDTEKDQEEEQVAKKHKNESWGKWSSGYSGFSATKNTQYGGSHSSKWNRSWQEKDKDSSGSKSYYKSQQESRSSSRGGAPWKRDSSSKGKRWDNDWGSPKKDKWSSR